MSRPALCVDGVSKKFVRGELYDSLRDLIPALTGRLFRQRQKESLEDREFWALRDVTFEVEEGEAFGVIGANGAGKSTLLKLLTGIMKPTSGRIAVRGRLSALIEVSAGFHPDLTGRENIFLNGAILGMRRQEIQARFDEIVAFSGLEEFIDTPVKRYSSGMYARLGFSVAAHVDPDVLLVDEVLSVGDYLFQKKCVERMNSVIEEGTTVVFVSHNLRSIADLCPRSLLLQKGQVRQIGPTGEVLKAYLDAGERRDHGSSSDPAIDRVEVGDRHGPRVEFQSDGTLRITVDASAQSRHEDLSVVVQIVDDQQFPLFDTCTQRLGAGPLTLEPDKTLTCTFEVDLSLAEGTYHVNAFLHRYVTNQPADRWLGAATFFVSETAHVRGVVNLHPRLLACEQHEGAREHRGRERERKHPVQATVDTTGSRLS